MADILAILPGVGMTFLIDLPIEDLARWHARAIARSPRAE